MLLFAITFNFMFPLRLLVGINRSTGLCHKTITRKSIQRRALDDAKAYFKSIFAIEKDIPEIHKPNLALFPFSTKLPERSKLVCTIFCKNVIAYIQCWISEMILVVDKLFAKEKCPAIILFFCEQ